MRSRLLGKRREGLLEHVGRQVVQSLQHGLALFAEVGDERLAVRRQRLMVGDLECNERIAGLTQLLIDRRAELFGTIVARRRDPVAEAVQTGMEIAQQRELPDVQGFTDETREFGLSSTEPDREQGLPCEEHGGEDERDEEENLEERRRHAASISADVRGSIDRRSGPGTARRIDRTRRMVRSSGAMRFPRRNDGPTRTPVGTSTLAIRRAASVSSIDVATPSGGGTRNRDDFLDAPA
ncbi:MAG: hypothetical protein U1F52_10240 [Burkholderiales bacterium]